MISKINKITVFPGKSLQGSSTVGAQSGLGPGPGWGPYGPGPMWALMVRLYLNNHYF